MYIHVSTSNFLRDSPFVLILEIKVQLSVPWPHNRKMREFSAEKKVQAKILGAMVG